MPDSNPTRTRLLTLSMLTSFLITGYSDGGVPPIRDARDGVLESSVIVIVQRAEGDLFRVDGVLLGEARVGDLIELPGFRLNKYGPFGNKQEEPFTQGTVILLFLQPRQDAPKEWVIACHGNCYFWVDDPLKASELEKMAKDAIVLRDNWEKAKAIADPSQRIEALWPYLWNCGDGFAAETKKALLEIGPLAGDYLAQRYRDLNHNNRMLHFRDVSSYGSQKLHDAILEILKQQMSRYEAFLKEHGPGSERFIEDLNNGAPEGIKDVSGELYWGLAGLAGFKDEKDLPFIRELAKWSIRYRFKGACDAALGAFRGMPKQENLKIIEAIWKEFSTKPYHGEICHVARALRTHKFPETFPLLVQCLSNKEERFDALYYLKEITGQHDLGFDQAAWLNWYAAYGRAHSAPLPSPQSSAGPDNR